MTFFDSLFVSPDEAERADKITQGLVEVTQKRADLGRITQEEANTLKEEIMKTGSVAAQLQDPNLSPWAGFQTGLDEGASNIKGVIGGTIEKTTGTFFKMIPWQLYAIGGVILLVYLWPLLMPMLLARRRT